MRPSALASILILLFASPALSRGQSAAGAPPPANGEFRFSPNLSAPPFCPSAKNQDRMHQSPPLREWYKPWEHGRIDPKMVFHTPQSAIGSLPPSVHILPNIYPRLTMLLIHADSAAGAALPAGTAAKPKP
jgi:hypothetical protein